MHIVLKPSKAELTHDTDAGDKMDPYVKIFVNGNTYQTDVSHKGGKAPHWNDSFDFSVTGDGNVQLSIWDKDTFSADDLIGDAVLNLFQLAQNGNLNNWHDVFFDGSVAGKIWIDITVIQPGQGPQILLRPIRAELTHDTDLIGKMDPFLQLNFNGKELMTGVCYKGGKTPVWNDSFALPLVGDGALRLSVWEKDSNNNDFIGDANLNLFSLAQGGPSQAIEIHHKGKKAGIVWLQITPIGPQKY